MRVSVSYCLPREQKIVELEVAEGCTASEAVVQSGLLDLLNNTTIESIKIGIFANKGSLDTQLQANDRVEIYRDLLVSPTQARKLRAKTQKLNSQRSGS